MAGPKVLQSAYSALNLLHIDEAEDKPLKVSAVYFTRLGQFAASATSARLHSDIQDIGDLFGVLCSLPSLKSRRSFGKGHFPHPVGAAMSISQIAERRATPSRQNLHKETDLIIRLTLPPIEIRPCCRHLQPSTPSRSHCGVQPLQLDAGVGRGEMPIGLSVLLVAAGLPCCDFISQGLLVGNASVETLS
jgi:hypothetical protein